MIMYLIPAAVFVLLLPAVAVAGPVLDAARERGWKITQIWNTHWHPDHIGGGGLLPEHQEAGGFQPGNGKAVLAGMNLQQGARAGFVHGSKPGEGTAPKLGVEVPTGQLAAQGQHAAVGAIEPLVKLGHGAWPMG